MLHRVTDTSVSSVISRTVQAFVEQVSGDPLCATGPLHAPGMLLDPEDPVVEMSAKSLFSWGFQSGGRRVWHWAHSQITQLVITSSSMSGKERMDLCESVKSGNLLKTRNLKGLPWGGDLFVGPKTEDWAQWWGKGRRNSTCEGSGQKKSLNLFIQCFGWGECDWWRLIKTAREGAHTHTFLPRLPLVTAFVTQSHSWSSYGRILSG